MQKDVPVAADLSSEIDKNENSTPETTDKPSNDSANETKTDETNDNQKNESLQNETTQFREIKLNMTAEKSYIVGAKCVKFEIFSNYSSFEIELDDLKNVTEIIVSEKNWNFSECKQESFQTCNGSTYCKSKNSFIYINILIRI